MSNTEAKGAYDAVKEAADDVLDGAEDGLAALKSKVEGLPDGAKRTLLLAGVNTLSAAIAGFRAAFGIADDIGGDQN